MQRLDVQPVLPLATMRTFTLADWLLGVGCAAAVAAVAVLAYELYQVVRRAEGRAV